MKLQDFVKASLLEIINGVSEANSEIGEDTGYINPVGRGTSNEPL